jgi:hypothetical protein
MSTKKTTNKKPAAKTAASKAKAARAKAAKAFKAKAAEMGFDISDMDLENPDMEVRRPDTGPSVPPLKQGELLETLQTLKTTLETYAAHLRALDRRRLNGVGIKKRGFIETAYVLAVRNPEFLPHWLTVTKFRADDTYFMNFRSMVDLAEQIRELLWNITIEASDVAYTDALEFYASVREAAKRRVDAAESPFNELAAFFKSRGTREGEPTEKQVKRDLNALLHGKRDGKIVVENIKPKVTEGKHKVIDEKFSDSVQIKESDETEIKE